MRIKVEFYDTLRELAGCHEWSPDLAPGVTSVSELLDLARRVFPHLAEFTGPTVFTVGLDCVESNHVIREGETISILPSPAREAAVPE